MFAPVTAFFNTVRSLMGKVWWFFPIFMVGGGYFIPSLRLSVTTWPIPAEHPNLPWWVLAAVLVGVLWVFSGFFHASNLDTPVKALKADAFMSTTIFGILTAACAFTFDRGQLSWILVIAWFASMADVYITGDRAINNAAQKPLMQSTKGG
jgi:hypothetical protein